MKKRQLFIALSFASLAFAWSPLVLAESSATTSNTDTPASSSDPGSQADQVSAEEESKKLQERITAYKASLKTQPTAVQQATLKLKCKPAQAIGRALDTRVLTADKTRSEVYGNISNILKDIVPKIKETKINTDELVGQQEQLTKNIKGYTESVAIYKTALSDFNTLDCTVDPIAFSATLEAARLARVTVNEDMTKIRQYITDTLKPSLTSVKVQLEESSDKPDSKDQSTDKAVDTTNKKENQ
ncbi:hypothetical protein KDA11_05260 [Candidatus Saccharibacteria bacterium]|nr:hypothetical protein [Candidatus Saccharibacteria bacterium]